MNLRAFRLLAVLALLAVFTGGCAGTEESALDGRYSVTVVTENDHTFAAGEVSVGPLVIAGGTTTLQAGAEHHGTVTLLAGELSLDGTLEGDLMALGGTVELGETGVVTGDVRRAGGTLVRAEGSVVQGSVGEDAGAADLVGGSTAGPSLVDRIVGAVLLATLMGVAAWILARLAPRPVGRVQAAAMAHPVVAGALGTLVLLTAPALLVSMVFTLILIPLALALLLPLAGVVAYGVIGLGIGIAARVSARRGWDRPVPVIAAAGTALLVLGLVAVGSIPVLGLLALFAVGAIGTGAVLLTALGTRPYVAPPDP